jgi:hypothetical protein
MRHAHRVGGLVAAVATLTVMVACSPATLNYAAPAPTERDQPAPSASPSLATALPEAPGTTFVSAVTGNGHRALGAVPLGGTVNLVVACVGAGLDVERKPDISITLTCDGRPYNVSFAAAAKNDEPLEVIAEDTVSWAINASMGG